MCFMQDRKKSVSLCFAQKFLCALVFEPIVCMFGIWSKTCCQNTLHLVHIVFDRTNETELFVKLYVLIFFIYSFMDYNCCCVLCCWHICLYIQNKKINKNKTNFIFFILYVKIWFQGFFDEVQTFTSSKNNSYIMKKCHFFHVRRLEGATLPKYRRTQKSSMAVSSWQLLWVLQVHLGKCWRTPTQRIWRNCTPILPWQTKGKLRLKT